MCHGVVWPILGSLQLYYTVHYAFFASEEDASSSADGCVYERVSGAALSAVVFSI